MASKTYPNGEVLCGSLIGITKDRQGNLRNEYCPHVVKAGKVCPACGRMVN